MERNVIVYGVLLGFVATVVGAQQQQQQQVDPAYLRQYYQQIQQQSAEATPIYEQNTEQSQQYSRPGGTQIRIKDTVQEQIRAQQQQQQQQQGGYVAPAVREYLQQQQQQQIQYQAPASQPVYRSQALNSAPRHQAYHQQVSAVNQKAKLTDRERDEEEYDDANSSYQFGFDVKDDEFTNYQNRKEVRDGGVIKGSYSVVDSDGFIRTVKYTADPKEGFKAEVIREPTDIVVKIPTPAPQQLLRSSIKASSQEQYQAKQQYHQPQHQHPQQYHQYQ